MPLLDIATSQASCGNHICGVRAQLFVHGRTVRKITFRKDKKLSSTWKVSMPRKVNHNVGHLNTRDVLLIRAVYTLEQKHLIQTEDGEDQRFLFNPDSNLNMFQSPSETSSETEEKERLRRMRISTANKGNVPWNKGRKHSPETLRRIRERTRLAMQDPKVKMKLVNLGHAQTEETRVKIGVGVRMGWKRRRERLMVQETCCYEWQNLVAEASRKGYIGEEELQWDSYRILDKQLEQEWLDSIEKRKATPRTKGNKRAPKSPEQRKKISDAISAKWNDPEYRERVCSALEKYHGTPIGSSPKRPPRRRQSGDSESRKSPVKRKSKDPYYDDGNEKKNQTRPKAKRRAPKYKDPLADSKLAMLKSIRAQRMEMETKKVEAMERARLLITEAKKAAQALEEAAMTSPLARASLIETRKLIAEATRSIEAAETGQIISHEKDSYSSSTFSGQVNQFREEAIIQNDDYTLPNIKEVNGTHVRNPNNNRVQELEFGEITAGEVNQIGRDDQEMSRLVVNGTVVRKEKTKMPNKSKKWIRGRLVEVSDSDERVEQEE